MAYGISSTTKRSLSPARRRLVELMQEINFGRVDRLRVRDGEPVIEPGVRLVREVVFGKVNAPNPARNASDFELKKEVTDLFHFIETHRSCVIESLWIQNGLPARMTVVSELRVG